MIAKIIKGADFGGVINYLLSKEERKVKVLASNNIGFTDQNLCAHEFALQASMHPNVHKPVCHTILSFSANDAEQLTNDVMVKIANEYLAKMGYGDTQSLIVRHSDRQHPHLHICINRIGNDGKTISDRNEKYRSTKVCRELTERYGLTIGEGKKAVNRHRLRREDKLRYDKCKGVSGDRIRKGDGNDQMRLPVGRVGLSKAHSGSVRAEGGQLLSNRSLTHENE